MCMQRRWRVLVPWAPAHAGSDGALSTCWESWVLMLAHRGCGVPLSSQCQKSGIQEAAGRFNWRARFITSLGHAAAAADSRRSGKCSHGSAPAPLHMHTWACRPALGEQGAHLQLKQLRLRELLRILELRLCEAARLGAAGAAGRGRHA